MQERSYAIASNCDLLIVTGS
jgi:hypothetical protein